MISINFVGDIALFSEFEEKGIDPFKEIKLPESDYSIGNFEFIIPNNRVKRFFDVSDDYKVNYNYLNKLRLNTFDAFSLANNHCMDYGLEGAEDVLATLNKKKIKCFGFGKKSYNTLIFKIKDVSFATIAFVKPGRWSKNLENPIGPDSYDLDEILEEIKRLKKTHHHVFVYPHWGTELVDVPDPKDVVNARLFIDCGATAVIGHHPHIIQGVESYNKGVIAYSLGSFIYMPENELGYGKSQGKNRNYSICLNLTLDQNSLVAHNPIFYEYSEKEHIPKEIENLEIVTYFKELNEGIHQTGSYVNKVRKQLFIRELKSFAHRFKHAPIKTIIHYFNYIKLDHLKKLIK